MALSPLGSMLTTHTPNLKPPKLRVQCTNPTFNTTLFMCTTTSSYSQSMFVCNILIVHSLKHLPS